jgi:hypothetical protein
MFWLDVKPKVGVDPALNCHPVGAAKVRVTVQPPVAPPPKSAFVPSLTVIVPNVVYKLADPSAALLVHMLVPPVAVVTDILP